MEKLWPIKTVRKSITLHRIFTVVVPALLRTRKLLQVCTYIFFHVPLIFNLKGMVSSALFLHRKSTLRESRVVSAQSILKSHLFKYQGHVGAALVLGGFDIHGPQLFTIFPHGSSDCLPYATMGSGSLAAMSIFESDYKDHMSEDEAKLLVARSIRAGIFNDLGSGSNIDLCVLSRAGTKYFRNFEIPQERAYTRAEGYTFENGTTSLNKRNFQTATSTTAESENAL